MRIVKLLLVGIIILSSVGFSDYYSHGIRIHEPFKLLRSVDCGKLDEAIRGQRTKMLLLIKAAKDDPKQAPAIIDILPAETGRLLNYIQLFNIVCRTV